MPATVSGRRGQAGHRPTSRAADEHVQGILGLAAAREARNLVVSSVVRLYALQRLRARGRCRDRHDSVTPTTVAVIPYARIKKCEEPVPGECGAGRASCGVQVVVVILKVKIK